MPVPPAAFGNFPFGDGLWSAGPPSTPSAPAAIVTPSTFLLLSRNNPSLPGGIAQTSPPQYLDAVRAYLLMGRGSLRPALPGSFLAAVRAALRGDATLKGLIGGRVWKDLAPPGAPYPFVVLAETSRTPAFSTIDDGGFIPFTEGVSFLLTAYSQDPRKALAVANRVVRVLDDANLTCMEGVVLEVRHDAGFRTLRSPGKGGYGGSLIFQVVIPYEAVLQKFIAIAG